jgi:hypothetical protein
MKILFSALHVTMRHYATSRKVAGSSPGEVVEIFHLCNPSSFNVGLLFTQPLIEMSTRKYFSGVDRGWLVGLTTGPLSVLDTVASLTSLKPYRPLQPVSYGDSFTFTFCPYIWVSWG